MKLKGGWAPGVEACGFNSNNAEPYLILLSGNTLHVMEAFAEHQVTIDDDLSRR